MAASSAVDAFAPPETASQAPPMPFVKVVSVNGRDVTLSIQQSKTSMRRPTEG